MTYWHMYYFLVTLELWEDCTVGQMHTYRSMQCFSCLSKIHTPSLHTEGCPWIFSRHETRYIMYMTHLIEVQGGNSGIKNQKFTNLKWWLMLIGASTYNTWKAIYKFPKRFIRKWLRYNASKTHCVWSVKMWHGKGSMQNTVI